MPIPEIPLPQIPLPPPSSPCHHPHSRSLPPAFEVTFQQPVVFELVPLRVLSPVTSLSSGLCMPETLVPQAWQSAHSQPSPRHKSAPVGQGNWGQGNGGLLNFYSRNHLTIPASRSSRLDLKQGEHSHARVPLVASGLCQSSVRFQSGQSPTRYLSRRITG